MKTSLSNTWRLLAVLSLGFLALSCQEQIVEKVTPPYLEAVPEAYTETALGEGDGFLISVRSNVPWTLSAVDESGNPVDWIRLEQTSGEGDADILGIVLRGSRETDRTCSIVLKSTDGKLEKRFEMKQGMFVPVMLNMTLSDALKSGGLLPAGTSEELTDYALATAVVVGSSGANLPEGYIYVTDEDASCWARIKSAQASSVKAGDVIEMEYTGGTVTKEQNGSFTLDLPEPVKVKSSGTAIDPLYVSAASLAGYENMLVELRNVQAAESAVGKNWSGDVSLIATDEYDAAFKAYVESGASFAGSVPSGSGTVVGIVVDGKVRPRSTGDIALTGARIPAYVAPHEFKPIVNMFKAGGSANTYTNATISGATRFVFSAEPDYSYEGAVIEKVGGTANKMTNVVAVATPFQACFTTIQWSVAGTYLLYTIPVTESIWGELEWAFGISCGTANMFANEWEVSWSRDGTAFQPVDAVYSTANYTAATAAGSKFKYTSTSHPANRFVAEFSIPESEAITSGNIYFKLIHPAVASGNASKTMRVNCGSILKSRTKNTPKHLYHSVLAMENFESIAYGHNPVIGVPVYYFAYQTGAPAYSSMDGWAVSGTCVPLRGCLYMNATSGQNFVISPVLEKLKVPADIVVTFKAAPYVNPTGAQLVVNSNNISVDVTGSGTVGELTWDSAYEPYNWHTATVKITGAASDTQVMIGNLSADIATSAFYIDDIIISRN